MADEVMSIQEVQAWFAERGLRLEMRQEDDQWAADLVALSTQRVLTPRYGQGEDEVNAATRARVRYEDEQ